MLIFKILWTFWVFSEQANPRKRRRKTKEIRIRKKSWLSRESRCMSPAWWVQAPKNRNVRILAACSKILATIGTSLLSMMAMVLLGERLARLQTTTSLHNYRKVRIRETSINSNLKRMSKTISRKYLKTRRKSWKAVALTIQVQVPAQYLFCFKATNAISPTWVIQELFCLEIQ